MFNWTVISVSLVYVSAELAFNARLLDLMVGTPSRCQLDGIELFGRVLSGIGLAILAWRLTARHLHDFTIKALAIACAISVPIAYGAQEALVTWLVDRSSGAERRAAQALLVLSGSVLGNQAQIVGIEAFALREDASGKTFIALLPAFGLSSQPLLRGLEEKLPEIVERLVRQEAGDARTSYTGYIKLYNKYEVFVYPKYWELSEKIKAARSSGNSAQAGRELQWYRREMTRQMGTSSIPPPGLTKQEFLGSAEVRGRVRQELGRVDPKCTVTLEWNEATFEKCAHEYAVRQEVRERQAKLRDEIAAFGDGGKREREGRDAYKAVVIPAVALLMSLFFGLLNLAALVVDVLSNAFARVVSAKANRRVAYALIALLLLVAPWFLVNPITQGRQYQELMVASRSQARLVLVPAALDWAIRLEPAAYPLMSFVHQRVFFGASFAKPGCAR